jgi:hypothetical protein
MFIPRYWARSRQAPAGKRNQLLLQTWGWSDVSLAAALEHAEQRLQKLLQRVRDRDDLARWWWYYTNGERPLREEILDARPAGVVEGQALVTRNRYGAAVLNTARLLFIDIDLPEPPPQRRGVLAWFSKPATIEPAESRLERLKAALVAHSASTFRLYRTAGGFRAVALDREFDPVADEVAAMMQAVGADPMYVKLCRAQQNFRARLSPKPWRCGVSNPPGQYPRDADGARAFAAWLADYNARASGFGTCLYLETLGRATALPELAPLIDFHDRATRALEPFALA